MTDLFKEKARDWDANTRRTAMSSAIAAAIIEHVELNQTMHVLDFGAGTGLLTGHIAPRVEKIAAIDVSQSMLEKLQSKPELAGKVDIVCQDITQTPLDKKFDLLVSAMAMHHVQDTENMAEKFALHLKPGARLAVADLDTEDGSFHADGMQGVYHAGFDRDAFKAVLMRHGFVDVRFFDAHTVEKEGKAYPVFLAVAVRSAA